MKYSLIEREQLQKENDCWLKKTILNFTVVGVIREDDTMKLSVGKQGFSKKGFYLVSDLML